MTQGELAREIGLSRQETVSEWENDRRIPRGKNLVALADALSTTVEKLQTGAAPTGDQLPPDASRDEALRYAIVRVERVLEELRGLISPADVVGLEEAVDDDSDPGEGTARRRGGGA